MDSTGGIGKFGMDYTPISTYNNFLKDSLGNTSLDAQNESFNQFQNILDNKIDSIHASKNDINPITAGISINNGISGVEALSQAQRLEGPSAVQNLANGLGGAISNGVNNLNQTQLKANKAVETLASGGDISVHEVMIASQKASLNMQMAMQLRNKVLQAYTELSQMRF